MTRISFTEPLKLTTVLIAVFFSSVSARGFTPRYFSKNSIGRFHKNEVFEALNRKDLRRRAHSSWSSRHSSSLTVESYHLKGRFDWKSLTLLAQLEISLHIDSSEKHITLDSAVTRVKRVNLKGGKELPFIVGQEHTLEIDLSSLNRAGDSDRMTIQIDYETYAGNELSIEESALHVVLPRKGDPITSKVAYTHSEPLGASYWLPCHNIPSERAKFSAEFTMAAEETLIANGTLTQNVVQNGIRTMGYATDYPLPTYLMAFAIGDFQRQSRMHGKVPLSIVWRRGLPLNAAALLDMLEHQIKTYESLLVPYPFEKYFLVLVPEFPASGIEHAGITFQEESKSSDPEINDDFWLSAHELAHQWFGDLVTVESWDDLWFKEGMADLMAQEARRIYEDKKGSGRLMGWNHAARSGEAIYDPSLPPDLKYTSGPYARSAWLFTQIRSIQGENNFWSTWRQIFTEHAYGSIGTETLLRYFGKSLGPDVLKRIRLALTAKALPRFILTRTDRDKIAVTLNDSDQSMIVPLDIARIENGGHYSTEVWRPGETKTFSVSIPNFFLLDIQDIHPIGEFETETNEAVAPWFDNFIPRSFDEMAMLTRLGSHHFHFAASHKGQWALTPSDFQLLFPGIPSELGKTTLIQLGCEVAEALPRDSYLRGNWSQVIREAIETMPKLGALNESHDPGFTVCESFLNPLPLKTLWEKLTYSPSGEGLTPSEIVFLSSIPLSPDQAFKTWEPVARQGNTVRSRTRAVLNLVEQLKGNIGKLAPSGPMLEHWKEFFRELLASSEAAESLETAMDGCAAAQDLDAVPNLIHVIESDLAGRIRKHAICAAHDILHSSPQQWAQFITQVKHSSHLPKYLESYLEEPELCGDR